MELSTGLPTGPYLIEVLIHKGVLTWSCIRAFVGSKQRSISRSIVKAFNKPGVCSQTPGSMLHVKPQTF